MDKLDLVIDRIQDLKDSHGKRLDAIDNNLDIHMSRNDELERSNELMKEHFDKRLIKLEEPIKARKYIWRWLLGLGSLLGIVFLIIRLYLLGV